MLPLLLALRGTNPKLADAIENALRAEKLAEQVDQAAQAKEAEAAGSAPEPPTARASGTMSSPGPSPRRWSGMQGCADCTSHGTRAS